jgi:predicted ATP-grasp superfamily ATP-dependent carboligase
MSQRLIIVGASARAAAYSALRAGFEPYAIDCYADRDLAAACPAVRIDRYPCDFEPALVAAPQAPWLYTGGLENHPQLIERMAKLRPLWGNSGKGLREIRRPQCLAEVVGGTGLRLPRTSSVISPHETAARWLVKRRCSSGGVAVRFAEPTETSKRSRGSFYQEYIEGQSASATFVAAGGRAALLGTTSQLLGRDIGLEDRPFLYAGSVAPLQLTGGEMDRLQSLGGALAARFGLVGLFGVDFVRTQGALWPIEVNPRYTASIEVLERATGASFLELHAAACISETIPGGHSRDANSYSGKQVVYAAQDLIVPSGIDLLVADWNCPGQPVGIADLPRIGERIVAGQPIATILAQGISADKVRTELQIRAAKLVQVLRLSTEY